MSSRTATITTADELLLMPDDGFRYELVSGELLKMSPAGSERGMLIVRLTAPLMQHVDENDLGEVFGAGTGFKLESDPDTVRAPDIAFVRRERIPKDGVPREFWSGAPDLAVEVVSPGDLAREVNQKISEYFAAGALAVWILNPRRRTLTIHRSGHEPEVIHEDGTIDGGDVIPGFQYRVAKLFRGRNR